VLRRYYDNNPARYTAPEYRRVRAIILSPQTIARTLDLSDADLRAWWEAHKGEFQTVEKRSAQVVTAPNADAAAAILALWKSGANWEAVQAAAQAHGATAVALDDTTPAGVPSPDLARAIFSAPQDAVEGPVVEPLGVQVFKVTRITPAAHPGFEQMKETIRQRLGEERAADLIDQRAQKLQDVIAGGATLDEIPADLGAAAVAGTLDEKGNTTEGVPAPLPGTPALRSQVIADAFRLTPGEPLKVTEGPDHAYYVLQVQSITKPAAKPFEAVREQVLKDWTAEQVRHTEEALAAKLLGLIKSGQSLTSAAWGSGLSVQRTPPLERGRPAPGLPAERGEKVFALHGGEPTMVETNQGFVVAVLAAIERPDLRTDKLGVERVQQELTRSLAQDVVGTYASALRDRANPRVNQRLLEQVIQQ
jgi:peptidyl-prolyl cis-trans isomerase D